MQVSLSRVDVGPVKTLSSYRYTVVRLQQRCREREGLRTGCSRHCGGIMHDLLMNLKKESWPKMAFPAARFLKDTYMMDSLPSKCHHSRTQYISKYISTRGQNQISGARDVQVVITMYHCYQSQNQKYKFAHCKLNDYI